MSRTIAPEDVLRLRFIRDAQLSPDGRSIAYALSFTDAANERDISEIRLLRLGSSIELDSGIERRISESSFATNPRWSRDGSHLAYVDAGASRWALVIVRERDGARRVVDIPDGTIADRPAWSPDGRKIALIIATQAQHNPHLHRITARHFRADGVGFTDGIRHKVCLIDVTDGTATILLDQPGLYSNLEWDDAGERILFLRTSSPVPFAGYSPHLYSIRLADRQVTKLLGDGWFIKSAQWLPDSKQIAVVGAYRSRVTVAPLDLWVVNGDGSEPRCRSVDVKARVGFRFHHDMPIWHLEWRGLVIRDAKRAWVTVQDGGRAEIWEISLSGPTRSKRVIGGERCCIALNASARGDKLLFLSTDLLNPTDLHFFDGKSESAITKVNREVLSQWPQMRQQRFTFRSDDGLELEGWFMSLTSQVGPAPTVMFVHGGPFIATGQAWRFDFHMLASHGFALAFANFRGSYGYGEELAHAIVGDWGGLGFPDHMAAVDRVIELGLADVQRLGVWGHSHGGFATCWIVGHTNRFRAAVAEAAVTDIDTAYYVCDAPDFRSFDIGGKPHEIPDVYRARSPLTYAHRCKTPTLVLHGEQDLRCPIEGAESFYRALLDVGCVSEMVRMPNASHLGDSIGPPQTRVAQNVALLDWFKRFL